jgi:ribosomal protein S18 acetylase RimI-like enzyme
LLRGPVGLSAFAPVAAGWLARDPVRHNQLGTVVGQRLDGALPVEPDSVWALLHGDDGSLEAVATWTPPRPLLVPELTPEAAACLVDELLAGGFTVPGVTGLTPGPGAVAEAWTKRTGDTAEPGMSTLLHSLGELEPPQGVPGQLIRADFTYRAWVTRAVAGFEHDAHGAVPPVAEAEREADQLLSAGLLWLWEVRGEPVSMAAARPPANGVYRIAMVYTPPEQRRHGYAAAAVAEVSRHLRDIGADEVTLYTDVANPTSNGVYQRIGYRPIAEGETWTFVPRPGFKGSARAEA